MSGDFPVQTKVFAGPLSLLLELIEKRKLLINELSLSEVTNDFLKFISEADQKDLEKITEFISIASTLVLIKSKSILPKLDLATEEKTEIEDLEMRLKLLQIFKNASKEIEQRFNTSPLFSKLANKKQVVVFSPTKQIEPLKIKWFIDQLIHNLPKTEKKPEQRVAKVISLEEMMNKVINRVRKHMSSSFNELRGEYTDRKNVIIGFLAILELVKLGSMNADQDRVFTDITFESTEPSVPNYGA